METTFKKIIKRIKLNNREDTMEITAKEMKKSIEKIYEELDKVTPVNFDCGKLCNSVCCAYDEDDYRNKDLALYLLPGEELIYEDNEYFKLYYVDPRELDYPYTWKEPVFLVECTNPPHCDRKKRPIQCRTFPLIPHISKKGRLQLIFDKNEFPYQCPIIEENIKLNETFIETTYKIWKKLITNPQVYDLIEFDSRRRENRRTKYKKIR